mmetsp:Transcript_25534/g.33376  ORF Transcript_25534/g.33376 Transcript_25534/m.33376 type:complete len:662 (-) Transcript_25534:326-2311(-)|eukprot:CAMPEP_0117746130 /NCGR_PEP_ID=MMETSP0947-20121206/7770_1 /TAXON_ID=44440 /ORGANISM="Chattonella subsalsa, Strain CCMP2191" /LENGTH=661 /DNA_ID=CAMNT_0005563409 /DNA_START=140 /DNA_END=2125 /DNA_ORIENTATION=+
MIFKTFLLLVVVLASVEGFTVSQFSSSLSPANDVLGQKRLQSFSNFELYSTIEADTEQKVEEITQDKLRNIAIIAHVDHGKTTLVDALLKESDVFRANEEVSERVMDSNDQERERGITILAKNCAINYKGVKINLVDTPGHADFGGEVERIMNMVDAVLLVVDSVEGPRPQTRFVLKKALELGLTAMVVVNKIDRPAARPDYVIDKTFDLFCELNATDEQTDFPICYASALNGIAGQSPDEMAENMVPMLDKILELPAPKIKQGAPTQLLVANIDYDNFKGKLAIGRLISGSIKSGQQIGFTRPGEPVKTAKVTELFTFDNLGRKTTDQVEAGEIVMIAGAADIGIGDTVVDPANPKPLEPLAVEEPTVTMTFGVNKSPLGGREGKLLTSRMIRDRLEKELEKNVALRMSETDSADIYEVSGRGQLHLTVLIETMRREGFELLVGPPRVITKKVDGKLQEPFESVDVTCPDEHVGSCVDLLSKRKGEMLNMAAGTDGTTTLNYVVPTRGMIGLRSQMLTATRGTAVMDTVFNSYRPFAGEIEQREKGSLLAYEAGTATTNGLLMAQNRGNLFIDAKTEVYKNMIVGVHQRPGDLQVNVCKTKALNNIRSATKEVSAGVIPPLELTLDGAVEYIQADEMVEVTPTQLRMLKNPDMDPKKRKQ